MRNLIHLTETDNSIAGNAISFIDIDETTFNTFARIGVMKDGKKVNSLSNQEFNTYDLKPGESFNFDEFTDSELFNKTSKPSSLSSQLYKSSSNSFSKSSAA